MSEMGEEEMASLPVPDDLLAEIFLRLPTPADLLHASHACTSFRRVAALRSFIRRFRKLHAPPLLGFLDGNQTFYPAIPPHPSAPAASVAAVLVADFSFLPIPTRAWVVQDSRDGRVLLDSAETDEVVFADMVVCDPLHRRYLLLPPIPHDLAASVEDTPSLQPQFWRETFLLPPCYGELEDETSFRVVWMAHGKAKLFAFVFSSRTGQWQAISSPCWKDLFWKDFSPRLLPSKEALFRYRQDSYGCFYWRKDKEMYAVEMNDLLMLDTKRMKFSTVEPPLEAKYYAYGFGIAMVEAGQNRIGMFMFRGAELRYSVRQTYCWGLVRYWQMDDRTISLGPGHYLIGSTGRYLLLYKSGSSLYVSGFYTLDIETFQLEKVCHAMVNSFLKMRAYNNFPPSFLSLPTILSGAEEEVEE